MPIDLSSGPAMNPDLAGLVAGVVVVLAWFVIFVVVRRAKHGGLEPEQKRRLADIRAELDRVGGPSLTIPDTAAGRVSEAYGGQLRSLFTDTADVDERVSTPLRALARRWRDRAGPIPRLAAWVGTEAVLLGVPAAIVLVQVSALNATQGFDLPVPSLESLLAVVNVGVDAVALFPATNILWAVVLTAVIMLYQWLYANALGVALVLAIGAATTTYLDRRTKDSIDVRLYPRRRATARHVLARLVLVWVAGVSLATTGQLAGSPGAGSLLGALLAFGLLAYYAWGAARSLWRRLNNEYEALTNFALPALIDGRDYQRERTIAYLAGRKAVAGLGVLALPLIPVYLFEAITSGIPAKLNAFLSSGPLVQAAVLLITGSIVWLLAQVDPREWQRLYLALWRAASRNAVRAFLIARGLPVLAVAAALLLGLAFQLPAWIVAIAAVGVGLGVRGLGKLWQRLTYRARRVDIDRTPPNVDVMVDHITTPDGKEIGVARVHTHWIAWPTDDVLLAQIKRDVEAFFADQEPEESLPARYYEHLVDVGRVDPNEVARSTRAEVRADLQAIVKPVSASATVVEERLYSQYPDAVVDKVFDEEQYTAGRVSQGNGEYYWHGSR